jgi:hypothetical protein
VPNKAAGEDGASGDDASPEAVEGQATSEAADHDAPAVEHHGLGIEEALHEVEVVEHEYRPPAAGALSNVVTAAVVVVLGAAALLGSWSLGVGTAREPGPGTWPLLVSIVLVVLGVVLLLNFRRVSDAEKFSHGSWLVLAGIATMVVFVGLIDVIGFEIPSALLCFAWLRYLGREGWRMSIITSLGVVVGFYLVFVAALAVPIPHLF